MRSWLGITLGIAAIIVLGAIISCVYTIYPTDQVLLTRLGAPEAVITEPGLHFKIPFYQYANFMPRRLLTLEAASRGGDRGGQEAAGGLHLRALAHRRSAEVLPVGPTATPTGRARCFSRSCPRAFAACSGRRRFAAVFSRRRAKLMEDIRDAMNQETVGFGVVIEDVRIRHADLPPPPARRSTSPHAEGARARGERSSRRGRRGRAAPESRRRARMTPCSSPKRRARPRSCAARATRRSARILGEAYGQDPEFFAFYRSMQAYRDALKGDTTTLVLSPDSEFLKYLGEGAASARKRK